MLDFAKASRSTQPGQYGSLVQGQDGHLLMEFTMLERLWSEASQNNSYDPYTCAVRNEHFLECLDIAGARTLGSTSTYDPSNVTSSSGFIGNNEAVLDLEQGLNGSVATLHFGADVDCGGKMGGSSRQSPSGQWS